jgi:transcriptional regulator with XRE-family HTH domain
MFLGKIPPAMPRKTSLPASELLICRRLKIYREQCGLPRRLFARDAGIDVSSLIRIELGRLPLKYGVAAKITKVFNLNPLWLAYGEEPATVGVPLLEPDALEISGNRLFSDVFAEHAAEWRELTAQISKFPERKYGTHVHPADPKGRVVAEELLRSDLRDWLTEVPDDKFNDLVNRIRFAAFALVDPWPNGESFAVIDARRKAMEKEREAIRQRRQEIVLTKASTRGNIPLVRTLKGLLADARRLCAAKGKKTELAKALNVAPETVSRYLWGNREPGGDITLKLLKWVEEQERKS